mmetsp:Transcript_51263/g.158841  ORF Transcript_51263/g.158841 Transcript_51263/m.158841 type:complete len:259 (+) Transcript_51263:136-912(+)
MLSITSAARRHPPRIRMRCPKRLAALRKCGSPCPQDQAAQALSLSVEQLVLVEDKAEAVPAHRLRHLVLVAEERQAHEWAAGREALVRRGLAAVRQEDAHGRVGQHGPLADKGLHAHPRPIRAAARLLEEQLLRPGQAPEHSPSLTQAVEGVDEGAHGRGGEEAVGKRAEGHVEDLLPGRRCGIQPGEEVRVGVQGVPLREAGADGVHARRQARGVQQLRLAEDERMRREAAGVRHPLFALAQDDILASDAQHLLGFI